MDSPCRIAEEAGTCPICRRRMKKVRKIFTVWAVYISESQVCRSSLAPYFLMVHCGYFSLTDEVVICIVIWYFSFFLFFFLSFLFVQFIRFSHEAFEEAGNIMQFTFPYSEVWDFSLYQYCSLIFQMCISHTFNLFIN